MKWCIYSLFLLVVALTSCQQNNQEEIKKTEFGNVEVYTSASKVSVDSIFVAVIGLKNNTIDGDYFILNADGDSTYIRYDYPRKKGVFIFSSKKCGNYTYNGFVWYKIGDIRIKEPFSFSFKVVK